MKYLLLALPLLLTACTSDRFGEWQPSAPVPPVVSQPAPTLYQKNPNADLVDVPSAPKPLTGGGGVQAIQLVDTPTSPSLPSAAPLVAAPLVAAPLAGTPTLPTLPVEKPKVVAALPKIIPPAPPTVARPSIGSLGTWSVKDTDGACKLTLTSQAFFDYQRASSNCKSASLSKVNAWEKKGSEIILYEPGGKVAARLSEQGAGSYGGSTTKGADIYMSR